MATAEPVAEVSQKAPAKSDNLRLIVVLTLIVFSVTITGTGVVFYLARTSPGTQLAESEVQEKLSLSEPIYVDLAPAFTVNFRGARGPRFLQISVEVMTREAEVEDLLKQHMPVIRSQLILLFSSQSSEDLDTREGKEKLIQETLDTIQGVLKEASGKKGIEAVYFTNFVMQ